MQLSETPWNDELLDAKGFKVFRDGYPVTEGHLLFVPKEQDWQSIVKCWEAAYKWGYDWIERGYCDAFNVGQNIGEEAGQTVMYPHVHLIPRRKGDMTDPKGGVRGVIPNMQKYKIKNPNQPDLFLEGDCV